MMVRKLMLLSLLAITPCILANDNFTDLTDVYNRCVAVNGQTYRQSCEGWYQKFKDQVNKTYDYNVPDEEYYRNNYNAYINKSNAYRYHRDGMYYTGEKITLLHRAALEDEADKAMLLLEQGANIQAKDWCGESPLHHAAHFNSSAVANVLMQAGANIEAKSDRGVTPLHYACWHNAAQITRKLIQAGANIENRSRYDYETPIYVAAGSESVDVLKELIAAGANLNIKNRNGWRPLHSAVHNGRVGSVQALIDAKANLAGRVSMTIRNPEEPSVEQQKLRRTKAKLFSKCYWFGGEYCDWTWDTIKVSAQEMAAEHAIRMRCRQDKYMAKPEVYEQIAEKLKAAEAQSK